MAIMKKENKPPQRAAFGVAEVAERYGVSAGLLRLEIARGRLRAHRIGRRQIILLTDFENYLKVTR